MQDERCSRKSVSTQFLQILSLMPFEKAPILLVLTEVTGMPPEPEVSNQLKRFN